MQVNAINSLNNLHFEGKKSKKNNSKDIQPVNHKFMKNISGPVAAAMFLIPVTIGTQSCEKTYEILAEANACVEYTPPEPHDDPFPYEIEDSLNIWRGDYLDIPVSGDEDHPGDHKNQALMNIRGLRDWDYKRPESLDFNLSRSRKDEAYYDHIIADSLKNDIRITKVKPGDITVVKKDGSITSNVSGLMFNEDGQKVFMHSNGKDRIFVYPKALSGEHRGKFVELGTVERGYLYDVTPEGKKIVTKEYGENFLLNSILSSGTEDHYIQVKGKAVNAEDLKKE